MIDVDQSEQVCINLKLGERSLQHARLVHGSPPKPSGDRRIGLAICHIPTYVKHSAGEDSATLVGGADACHQCQHQPALERDVDTAFVALHTGVVKRSAAILHRGTAGKAFTV